MLDTPGPPLEDTMVLTAGLAVSVAGYSWNAIGIVAPPGSRRSTGTVTVPHRAPADVPAGQGTYTAVDPGPDAAAAAGPAASDANTSAPTAGPRIPKAR